MEASPAVVQQDLETRVWGEGTARFRLAARAHPRLRAVLDKPFAVPMIQTRHGIGYRIAARCRRLRAADGSGNARPAAAGGGCAPASSSITLLGFCLTALFAYSTTLLRTRVENQAAVGCAEPQHRCLCQRVRARSDQCDLRLQRWAWGWVRQRAPRQCTGGLARVAAMASTNCMAWRRTAAFAYKLAVRRTPIHGSSSPTT